MAPRRLGGLTAQQVALSHELSAQDRAFCLRGVAFASPERKPCGLIELDCNVARGIEKETAAHRFPCTKNLNCILRLVGDGLSGVSKWMQSQRP